MEDDEAGRLAGFRARFGTGFDSGKGAKKATDTTEEPAATTELAMESATASTSEPRASKEAAFEDEQNDFEEDDVNLLDLISSFGQEKVQQGSSKKGGKGGKGGKGRGTK